MLNAEHDARVIHFLIKAFPMKDDLLRAALLEFLKRPKKYYRAHGAALHYLGMQRHPSDIKLLLDAASDENAIGMHAIVR